MARPKYWQIVKETIVALGGKAGRSELIKYAMEKYPDAKKNSLSDHLYAMSVNSPSRLDYPENQKARGYNPRLDVLYKDKNQKAIFELYDPAKHGEWTIVIDEKGKPARAKDGIIVPNDSADFEKIKRVCKEEFPKSVRNFREIAIKTLLQSPGFTAELETILENIDKLTFGQGHGTAPEMIREYLRDKFNIVKINGNTHSLLLSPNTSSEQVNELLKICGQAIAKYHFKKIANDGYNLWRMLPGKGSENYPYEREFLESNTIGIGWGRIGDDVIEKKMTKEQTKELFHKNYPPNPEGKPNSPQPFTNFTHEMKPKDIVVLFKKKTIVDFGIVVGSYRYQKDPSIDIPDNAKSYSHRRDVVWLNRGSIPESEISAARSSTCDRIIERKEQYINLLLEEETSKQSQYFLLRHKPKGAWQDDPGKKYHVGRDKDGNMGKRVGPLLEAGIGTKTIWYTTSNGEFYFWGYGTVTGIEEEKKDKSWFLTYNDFKFFEGDVDIQGRKLQRATESVNQQLQDLQHDKKWKMHWQYAINPIPKKIYEEITGDRSTMSEEEGSDTLNVSPYINILHKIPNLILYGPPGTGKTFTAKKIAEKFTNEQANQSGNNSNLSSIGVCFPSDQGIPKIKKFQEFLKNHNNKLLWGVGWSINDEAQQELPINGYVYFRGEIIAIAQITKITSHDETSEFEHELRPERQDYPDDYKFYLHIEKLELCEPFSHKQLQLVDTTKTMPDVVQQRVYVRSNDSTQTKSSSIKAIHYVTFHPSFSYEDFIEGYRPDIGNSSSSPYVLDDGIFKKVCDIAKDNPERKIVLIIDEINRGNIPKIFGELISLIEDDKRGSENSLELVYSKKNFFVPENLYIIGTMNTADKSLVQMDEALRRRFAFEELMPEPELLEKENRPGKKYKDILEKLNQKIVSTPERMKQYRDKQIGHSYFWNIENDADLQFVIKYQIIPLLQDYFYDDYEEIKTILGDKIIGSDNRPTDLLDSGKETELKKILLDFLNNKQESEQEEE